MVRFTMGLLVDVLTGGGAFVALFLWENRKEEEQMSRITRNETLSRLPVRLATNRIVELAQLRDNTRPVSSQLTDTINWILKTLPTLLL